MMDKEKREASERLFEALSGVDPALLERSEQQKGRKVIPWTRWTSVAAACIAFLVLGVSYIAINSTGGGTMDSATAPQSVKEASSATSGAVVQEQSMSSSVMAEDAIAEDAMAVETIEECETPAQAQEAYEEEKVDRDKLESILDGAANEGFGNVIADNDKVLADVADYYRQKSWEISNIGSMDDDLSEWEELQSEETLGKYLVEYVPEGWKFVRGFSAKEDDGEDATVIAICYFTPEGEISLVITSLAEMQRRSAYEENFVLKGNEKYHRVSYRIEEAVISFEGNCEEAYLQEYLDNYVYEYKKAQESNE